MNITEEYRKEHIKWRVNWPFGKLIKSWYRSIRKMDFDDWLNVWGIWMVITGGLGLALMLLDLMFVGIFEHVPGTETMLLWNSHGPDLGMWLLMIFAAPFVIGAIVFLVPAISYGLWCGIKSLKGLIPQVERVVIPVDKSKTVQLEQELKIVKMKGVE